MGKAFFMPCWNLPNCPCLSCRTFVELWLLLAEDAAGHRELCCRDCWSQPWPTASRKLKCSDLRLTYVRYNAVFAQFHKEARQALWCCFLYFCLLDPLHIRIGFEAEILGVCNAHQVKYFGSSKAVALSLSAERSAALSFSQDCGCSVLAPADGRTQLF